jgi:hypothetical protein
MDDPFGSVSAAGARPGLQNRCADDVTSNPHNELRRFPDLVTAHRQRAASDDPDLAAVVAAWPELSKAIKAGIMAMVKSASE